MAKKQNGGGALAVVEPPKALMEKYGGGIGHISEGQSQATPRLKVIQAMSAAALKEEHGEGAVILQPDGLLVARKGEPFNAIPTFRWPSWAEWASLDEGMENPIVFETRDPKHPVAIRAKSRNRVDENGHEYREHLNYAMMLETGHVAVYSWSRGGWKIGVRLGNMLASRGLDIFCNRLTLTSSLTANKRNQSWYVLDPRSAADPWVTDQAELDRLRELTLGFVALHEAEKLSVAPM
jgi:hypothetical protein